MVRLRENSVRPGSHRIWTLVWGETMRGAVRRTISIFWLATVALMAQPQRTPVDPKPAPQEAAPAARPTLDKSAEAAKAGGAMAAPVDPRTYEIGPEDILSIRVWREPELSSGVQVRPDGKITLPLIGEVQAAGLTPDALKAKLVEAFSEFINKPEIVVSLQQVLSRRYYLVGEVNRPGGYPLVVPITVLDALTNAGGFREFANTKKITILRAGKLIKFNYKDVIKGKNMDQNIRVENGDYIVVP